MLRETKKWHVALTPKGAKHAVAAFRKMCRGRSNPKSSDVFKGMKLSARDAIVVLVALKYAAKTTAIVEREVKKLNRSAR